MLRLASSAQDSLRDILDMLEELSFTLPRFQAYEKTLALDGALEMALIDVYTEVICFYARSIHFFRSHPHVLLRRGAWEEFRTDFSHTIRRIKKQSSIVESEADLARMRNGNVKYQEVLELLEDLKKSRTPEQDDIKCYHIPSELNTRFWGREEVLKAIDAALAAAPDVADKIRGGKIQAVGAIVGGVMKATRGQADAGRVRELILERLGVSA